MVRRSALLALSLVIITSIVISYAQAEGEKAATTQPAAAADPKGLETLEQKVAYSIGQNIGRQLKRQGLALDPAVLARGIGEGLAGNSALTDEQMDEAMMAYQQKLTTEQTSKNKGEGDKYLADNGKKQGVTTTASGLQYEVVKAGEGKQPTADDTVTVHYKGTLLNGEEFDSSYKRGQPATFPLKGVIPGWTEGVQLMKEGAKYRFVIPPNLAYGEQGTPGGPIGPNQVLVFEVELIKIGAPEAKPQQ
jgi:FKBP-type peptidyl-prolyl cis-trans isomerase